MWSITCDTFINTSFCEISMILLIGIHSIVIAQATDIVALFTHDNCAMGEEMSRGESSSISTVEKTTRLLFSANKPSMEFQEYNICTESEALGRLLKAFRDEDTLALIGPALHPSLCDSMASLAAEYDKITLSYYCIGDIRGDHSQHSYHRTMSLHSHPSTTSMLRSIPTSAVISSVITKTFSHFRYKRFAIYFTGDDLCWELAHSVLTSLSSDGFQLKHFVQLDTILNRNSTLDTLTELKSDTKGRFAVHMNSTESPMEAMDTYFFAQESSLTHRFSKKKSIIIINNLHFLSKRKCLNSGRFFSCPVLKCWGELQHF